jgi:hypothetical protein
MVHNGASQPSQERRAIPHVSLALMGSLECHTCDALTGVLTSDTCPGLFAGAPSSGAAPSALQLVNCTDTNAKGFTEHVV